MLHIVDKFKQNEITDFFTAEDRATMDIEDFAKKVSSSDLPRTAVVNRKPTVGEELPDLSNSKSLLAKALQGGQISCLVPCPENLPEKEARGSFGGVSVRNHSPKAPAYGIVNGEI